MRRIQSVTVDFVCAVLIVRIELHIYFVAVNVEQLLILPLR